MTNKLGMPCFERPETGGGLLGEPASAVRLEFRWFHTGELGALDLRPSLLSTRLAGTPAAVIDHLVHDEQASKERTAD